MSLIQQADCEPLVHPHSKEGDATPGVLGSVVGSTAQEWHGHTGMDLMKGQKGDWGLWASLQGEAEGQDCSA